jgi:Rrf2 family protein
MKISTKGRYGLRAVVDLAANFTGNPVLLRDIANRQEISRRYLERLFAVLKSAGIIRSIRGAQGGYILARNPNDILISEIIEALEGPFVPVDCVADETICSQKDRCVTRDIWCQIAVQLKEYFESMNLQSLVVQYNEKQGTKLNDYQI